MVQIITTEAAPRAIGPYSQAVSANGLIFVSGQIPLDPTTAQLVDGPIAEQTRQVLSNISAILKAAGSDINRVVKTTVFLKDLQDFDEMNRVYAEFFSEFKPARATVEVSRLPRDVSIEIEAVALV